VLQAVLAGVASGAHAASVSLDRSLAMSLCAPGETPPAGGSDQGSARHADMADCVMGCAVASSGAPAIVGDYRPVVHRFVDMIAFARRLDAPHGYVAGRSPANPRAPPSRI
jgi:hypothetical protein